MLLLLLRGFLCFKSCYSIFLVSSWWSSGHHAYRFSRILHTLFHCHYAEIQLSTLKRLDQPPGLFVYWIYLDSVLSMAVLARLGLWCHLSNYADIQNILSHKKCMFPFIVILGKDSSQEKIRIIWFKMKSWMILLLFRLWILQSSGSSWQYIKEWVYVSFCATADPKLAMRDSGYGEQNWANICGKQQDPLGLKSHIWLFSVLLPPGHNRCWFCWKQCE